MYLLWNLSKVADKSQDGAFDKWVTDAVQVHLITIEIGVKDVHSLHCSWAMLFVAKDQIYPVMEMGADIIAFQCLKPKSQNLF